MFGLGISEIIVIVVAGLIFIGPKQLPDFIRSAGRLFVQVRRAANEVKGTVDGVIREAEDELRKEKDSITQSPEIKELAAVKNDIESTMRRGSFDDSSLALPFGSMTP
ncbi:MAG: twin-arginine translocase subunit TatB [Pseudomonadota bacterium]|jgi:sec-independent protein translocase protein TatB